MSELLPDRWRTTDQDGPGERVWRLLWECALLVPVVLLCIVLGAKLIAILYLLATILIT